MAKEKTEKENVFVKWGLLSKTEKSSSSDKDSETSSESSNASVFDFTQTNGTAANSEEPIISSKATAPTPTPAPVASTDPKIAEKLRKVLTDANFPGPDYFEFKQQLDVLNDIIADEGTRYKAAFKSLLAQGITKEKITQSAQQYVGILTSENDKFAQAISQKSNTDIEFKTREAEVLNTENIGLNKQIEDIKAKIASNVQRIHVLGGEVKKAQSEISDAKKRFENTLTGFVNEIKKDSEKAMSYIQ